jgi:hypothetical protein
MKYLISILIVVITIVLLLSIFHVAGCSFLTNEEASILPSIAISTGVMIASLAYFRDKQKNEYDSQLKHDELQLQIAKEGFDEVYELISKLENSRVVWIRAARVLLNTIEIGELIETPQLKNAFKAHREYVRVNLYQSLHIEPEDPSESDEESLPPQFFYGVDNWRDRTKALDDAALESRSKIRAHRVTIDRVTPEPKNTELDTRSIVAIYDFVCAHDESYQDPLSNVKVWSGDLLGAFGIKQGPARYLEHQVSYTVIGGKLVELKKS